MVGDLIRGGGLVLCALVLAGCGSAVANEAQRVGAAKLQCEAGPPTAEQVREDAGKSEWRVFCPDFQRDAPIRVDCDGERCVVVATPPPWQQHRGLDVNPAPRKLL